MALHSEPMSEQLVFGLLGGGGSCRGPLRAPLGGGKSGREPETPARSPNTV